MGDRPNAKPLASNEDRNSDNNDDSVFGDNNNAVQEINNPSGGTNNEETPAAKSTADSSLSTKSAKSKASSFTKRLTSSHDLNQPMLQSFNTSSQAIWRIYVSEK
jgi:hypothetical protein